MHPFFLHRGAQSGFTLIEIIIALVVISVALGAVITTTGNSVKHGAHIKDKTIALWVAQNTIADIHIKKSWLATGVVNDNVTMAGQQWYIKNNIVQTPDENMRKMEVSVFSDKKTEDKLVSVIAYIVKPQELDNSAFK
ncbi:MAG: type II secretion system minor pseudopilin GspI [Gammaproteobacteria bacterium]|nr:type II secretion system minor pseudopilin GspI [Gammaproteobacteria bacterium]